MANKRFWIKVRNIGWLLFLVNQALIFPGNMHTFYREMFQPNQFSVAAHEIWSENSRGANVRECPELYCDIVVSLPHGTKIRSIEQVEGQMIGASDSWHRVEHDGSAGYVFGKLVREIDRMT